MGGTHPSPRKDARKPLTSKWRVQRDCEWSYGREKGPDSWWVYYPAAGGSHQSPIDIDPLETEFDSTLAAYPLRIQYSDYTSKVLLNTGHGVQVDMGDKKSYVTGGPMGLDKYRLQQFHFHWGDTDGCGSEHMVNNKAYSAELHFVHWNAKYGSMSEASEQHDGVVVLAVFLEKRKHNEHLSYIFDNMDSIMYKGQSTSLNSTYFDPSTLIPKDLTKYWVYQGSLTTPPCLECVTWVVFWDPIAISAEQLHQLRHLRSHTRDDPPVLDEFGGKIARNFRPLQERGHRIVRTMQHTFETAKDYDEQFHKQGLFTTHKEIRCQFNRQGITISNQEGCS